VGALSLGPDYRFDKLWTIDGDERSILSSLSRYIDEHRPTLVSFNGRGFDLPVVVLRSLRHGVTLSWYFEEQRYRDRRDERGHLDLCDALALHGAARRSVSLDIASRLVGLPGKVGVDGSQVEPLYRSGKLAEIQRYCLGDVAQTALLLLRYRRLQGQLTAGKARDAIAALLADLRRDGRLEPLLAQIDEAQLLG
jgi:predicted PolB exonuclease-like 3'-5' exonuclease